jgi:hypothetical protein
MTRADSIRKLRASFASPSKYLVLGMVEVPIYFMTLTTFVRLSLSPVVAMPSEGWINKYMISIGRMLITDPAI